ncbi:MAG TPA: FAD-dependent oxidoreductase [Novosphingobium sp.]
MPDVYPRLFSPFSVRGMTLPNRTVMAPMSTELGARDGSVTPAMIAFYRERAKGGFGLIVVEYTCVQPDTGRAHEYQLTLEDRRNVVGHRRLVRAVHEHGSKVFIQLQHSGQYATRSLLPDQMPVGPGDLFSKKDPDRQTCRALSRDEVAQMVRSFGAAAALAGEAGYDGVELHGTHGYLLSQFLSPYFNRRDDEWGGDFERRMAFPLAVIREVRKALGERVLSYRLSVDEFIPGGLTIGDMERIAPRLVEAGADLLHCSAGLGIGAAFETVIEPMSTPEGWRIPYAARIRQATGAPVIAVGQIRRPETAETALENEQTDLIALGRPSLADPDWPAKARSGQRATIRPCTSCNWCLAPHQDRHHVGCAENPRAGNELDPPLDAETGRGRRAVVVGAGPGGMAAALLLVQSGFETHLFEQRPRLGGGIIPSATPPGKDKLFWYSSYLEQQIGQSAANLHLGQRATMEDIAALAPDVVLLASGTERIDLPITGLNQSNSVDAYDILMGDKPIDLPAGSAVVIYGGGETGCECAEFCATKGLLVTLVTRSRADQLARSADQFYRGPLLRRLHANPLISVMDNCHVTAFPAEGVIVEPNAPGGAPSDPIKADRLILAQGRRPAQALRAELSAAGFAVSLVGDCSQVGRIGDAVQAAYRAVLGLRADFGAFHPARC